MPTRVLHSVSAEKNPVGFRQERGLKMLRKKMLYESVVNGTIKTRCYIMYRTSEARILDYIEEPEDDDCFGVTARGLIRKDGEEFPEPYSFEFSSNSDDIATEEFVSEYRHAFYVASRMDARFSIRFIIDGADSVFTVDVESIDDSWGCKHVQC